MKKIINIEGMTCGHCAGRVKSELESLEEVKSAEVSVEDKRAVVELVSEVSIEKLKEVVKDTGYTPVSVE